MFTEFRFPKLMHISPSPHHPDSVAAHPVFCLMRKEDLSLEIMQPEHEVYQPSLANAEVYNVYGFFCIPNKILCIVLRYRKTVAIFICQLCEARRKRMRGCAVRRGKKSMIFPNIWGFATWFLKHTAHAMGVESPDGDGNKRGISASSRVFPVCCYNLPKPREWE